MLHNEVFDSCLVDGRYVTKWPRQMILSVSSGCFHTLTYASGEDYKLEL